MVVNILVTVTVEGKSTPEGIGMMVRKSKSGRLPMSPGPAVGLGGGIIGVGAGEGVRIVVGLVAVGAGG